MFLLGINLSFTSSILYLPATYYAVSVLFNFNKKHDLPPIILTQNYLNKHSCTDENAF